MKKIIALTLLASLAGCASAPIATPTTSYPPVSEPYVAPPRLNDLSWKVYNASDIKQLAATLDGKGEFVIFALAPDGFKKLEANMSEINRYIKQQKAVKVYLKQVIDSRSGNVKK